MRILFLLCPVLLFAACAAPVSDSRQSGVGFGSYSAYQEELIRRYQATRAAILQQDPDPTPQQEVPTAQDGPANAMQQGPLVGGTSELSQEQDFGVVSAQRGIEEDAARIAAARQQYELVTPTDIERPDQTGPNIIAYALNAQHPVGTQVYNRGLFAGRNTESKCAGYRTDDIAQEAFLLEGGPERDRLGLDPDGDGYACGWNPATYRNLVRR